MDRHFLPVGTEAVPVGPFRVIAIFPGDPAGVDRLFGDQRSLPVLRESVHQDRVVVVCRDPVSSRFRDLVLSSSVVEQELLAAAVKIDIQLVLMMMGPSERPDVETEVYGFLIPPGTHDAEARPGQERRRRNVLRRAPPLPFRVDVIVLGTRRKDARGNIREAGRGDGIAVVGAGLSQRRRRPQDGGVFSASSVNRAGNSFRKPRRHAISYTRRTQPVTTLW